MLTPHQKEKANETLDLLTGSDRFVVLEGSAGVGKTYLANYIIRQFYRMRRGEIFCTAPTNKAVAVIRGKVDELPDLSFLTTHSALRMKEKINRKTGKVTFESYANPKYPILANVKLLVVDEASMLNTSMLDNIETYATKEGTKVLFIGDNKQLNPVGEDESPVFGRNYATVTLTEIIRQGEGNPIIDLSRNLERMFVKEDKMVEGIGGYLYSLDTAYIVDRLAEVNGTDELKYIAWTNDEVNKINDDVRAKIYGTPRRVEKGETLIFDAPYSSDGGDLIYFTNEEMLVNEVEIRTMYMYYPVKSNMKTGAKENKEVQLKVYCVNPGEKDLPDGVYILHEDSDKVLDAINKEMVTLCYAYQLEWKDYYAFVRKFATIKYNHALTVHKSQGSTFKKVVMNVRNINLNRNVPERQRLFYTGITRASELLILYKV